MNAVDADNWAPRYSSSTVVRPYADPKREVGRIRPVVANGVSNNRLSRDFDGQPRKKHVRFNLTAIAPRMVITATGEPKSRCHYSGSAGISRRFQRPSTGPVEPPVGCNKVAEPVPGRANLRSESQLVYLEPSSRCYPRSRTVAGRRVTAAALRTLPIE